MGAPVFKKSGVYQTLNLKEMFGVVPNKELRQAIGQYAIDFIRKRTENGAGIGGEPFRFGVYSDEYAESLEFKAHGKDKHEVNMTLTGDMLGLLDVIEESQSTVTIGWRDAKENAKAFNHNTGDTVPKRPFFGLTAKEVRSIADEFRPEVQKAVRESRANGRDAFTKKALIFLDALEGDDGE
jgi:hypothetical protein